MSDIDSRLAFTEIFKKKFDEIPLVFTNEPLYEKTGFLHMRKQRRRSALQ